MNLSNGDLKVVYGSSDATTEVRRGIIMPLQQWRERYNQPSLSWDLNLIKEYIDSHLAFYDLAVNAAKLAIPELNNSVSPIPTLFAYKMIKAYQDFPDGNFDFHEVDVISNPDYKKNYTDVLHAEFDRIETLLKLELSITDPGIVMSPYFSLTDLAWMKLYYLMREDGAIPVYDSIMVPVQSQSSLANQITVKSSVWFSTVKQLIALTKRRPKQSPSPLPPQPSPSPIGPVPPGPPNPDTTPGGGHTTSYATPGVFQSFQQWRMSMQNSQSDPHAQVADYVKKQIEGQLEFYDLVTAMARVSVPLLKSSPIPELFQLKSVGYYDKCPDGNFNAEDVNDPVYQLRYIKPIMDMYDERASQIEGAMFSAATATMTDFKISEIMWMKLYSIIKQDNAIPPFSTDFSSTDHRYWSHDQIANQISTNSPKWFDDMKTFEAEYNAEVAKNKTSGDSGKMNVQSIVILVIVIVLVIGFIHKIRKK